MKRLAFALGALALGLATATHASAAGTNYAVVKFGTGFCRVWADTSYKPANGTWLMWRHHNHVYYNLPSWDVAQKRVAWAGKMKHCQYWW